MRPAYEELTENLSYHPSSGEFWWIAYKPGRPMGTPAGCIAGKNKSGYRQIYFNGKPYQAAHLAWLWMTGTWPPRTVDHKNLVRADDRWDNLRLATRSENFGNQRCYKNNKIGLKGVSVTTSGKWIAQIQVNGKKIGLGRYATPAKAHAAYKRAAIKYFGEYARA